MSIDVMYMSKSNGSNSAPFPSMVVIFRGAKVR